MSSHYTTEPPPAASILLHTTAGLLTVSLFAQQTPLTTRNFLQHCLDGTYDNNLFHRVSPGFVIQTGDPTGTGEGGENIYEDAEFERYDAAWARLMGREKDEKIVFGDEIHSRLKFNRRGLVGMAKSEGKDAGYGSQWFITLGDCRPQLEGRCTMFGRVEGDGIYNVVKIAEGECVEGTERPVYPEKILKVEILEMPKGEAWQAMKPRQKIAHRTVEERPKEKPKKKKAGKALLSFGDDEDGGVVIKPKKAKFNTALIDGPVDEAPKSNGAEKRTKPPPARRKSRSPSPSIPQKRKKSPPYPPHHRSPSFHDSTTQLPLRNPESPSRSPTPDTPPSHRRSFTSKPTSSALEAEIAALKASMRRPTTNYDTKDDHKKSALEAMIPATSTRGRKRPRPGDTLGNAREDRKALKMLDAFRSRLEHAGGELDRRKPATRSPDDESHAINGDGDPSGGQRGKAKANAYATATEDEEAQLCDLHFIANCQSCSRWNDQPDAQASDDDDRAFLSHSLSFAKDKLGKDLGWRKDLRNRDEDDGGLVVIDPRAKEREIKETSRRERPRR